MAKERTVIAYFPSSTKAEDVVKSLYSAGVRDVHIRRNSRFGVSLNDELNDPLALNYSETLTGLTLFSAHTGRNENKAERILMGSDPSVSGYSDLGYGLAGGHAFSVVAFVSEENVDEVVAIMRQNGGEV